jgi:site-specific DNA-methyltransferase (adenine-specific)
VQLIEGDCLEVMPTLPDKSVDMILADWPYGTTICKWDSVIDLGRLWLECKRVIKDRAAVVLFAAQPFTSALIMSNIEWFKYCWVWEKSITVGFFNANHRPLKKTEDIAVFSKAAAAPTAQTMSYYPQGITRIDKAMKNRPFGRGFTVSAEERKNNIVNSDKPYIKTFTNYPNNILKFDHEEEKVHPTQKPIPLLEYLIRTYTNEGETVLDNTMGSGSTGVAAQNTGRNFIGIEKDPGYFQIAKQRIEKCESL